MNRPRAEVRALAKSVVAAWEAAGPGRIKEQAESHYMWAKAYLELLDENERLRDVVALAGAVCELLGVGLSTKERLHRPI